jgi:hypothetical protein
MHHRREVDIARRLAARAPDLKPGMASIYGGMRSPWSVAAVESESAGRVRRDGLEDRGERPPAPVAENRDVWT